MNKQAKVCNSTFEVIIEIITVCTWLYYSSSENRRAKAAFSALHLSTQDLAAAHTYNVSGWYMEQPLVTNTIKKFYSKQHRSSCINGGELTTWKPSQKRLENEKAPEQKSNLNLISLQAPNMQNFQIFDFRTRKRIDAQESGLRNTAERKVAIINKSH